MAGLDGGIVQAIAKGMVRGPRILPSATALAQDGGHGTFMAPWSDCHCSVSIPGLIDAVAVCNGTDEVRLAARRAFRRGARQLKLFLSGGVISLTDELSLPAGRKLAAEGASGHEFVVIAEGAAEVKRRGKVVNQLGAGDFVGEIALVTGQKRTATVTTTKPSRLLVLTAPAFRSLLRNQPALQLKVLDTLAERLPAE